MVQVIKQTQSKADKKWIILSEETFTACVTLMHTTAYTEDYVAIIVGEEFRIGENLVSVGLFLHLSRFTTTELLHHFGKIFSEFLNPEVEYWSNIVEKDLRPVGWFLIRPHSLDPASLVSYTGRFDVVAIQNNFQKQLPQFFCLMGYVTHHKTQREHAITVTALRNEETDLQEVPFVVLPFRFKNFVYGFVSLVGIYFMLQRRTEAKYEIRHLVAKDHPDAMQRYKYRIEADNGFIDICNRYVFPTIKFGLQYLETMKNYTFFKEHMCSNTQFRTKKKQTEPISKQFLEAVNEKNENEDDLLEH